MLLSRIATGMRVSLLVLTVTGWGVACAQNYPTKPIRFVAAEVGGGGDIVARIIAQGLTTTLGQPVIVDNRGNTSIEIVARAQPDGYTLLINGPVIWLTPFMRDNVAWDPIKDFTIVTLAVNSPSVLIVHPTVPATSVAELIALAKAKPGVLNYASAQAGSSSHIAGELFKAMTGVNIVRLPYKGNGPALNALISGEAQIMFAPPRSVAPLMKSGRLRALAVTTAKPTELVPGLPTVAAFVPGYEASSMLGIFAPAKTPAAIVNRLHQEIMQVLNRAENKERIFNGGSVLLGSPPQQSAIALKSEMAKWGKVIKDAGIREE